jgi:tripartite-type tricarboxylate transporter receptor subunit TctC
MNAKTLRVLIVAPVILSASLATAETYPTKPVHLVVPFPAGGVTDILARAIAQPLGASLGQPVIVDNRPGSGAIIGAEHVARSAPDGHTILLVGSTFTISAATRNDLPYDAARDFTGVARIAATPMLVACNPAVPAKTIGELVAFARTPASQLTYATAGNGVPAHLATEEFKRLARIEMTHVPFQGGAPAAMATIGGHTNVVVATVAELAPHVAAGKLRALAVTSAARSDVLKEVPTLAESGYPGFDASFWFGAWVPARTPKDVVRRLSAELVHALDSTEVREILAKQGYASTPMPAEAFDAFYRTEIGRYGKFVKEANLKLN